MGERRKHFGAKFGETLLTMRSLHPVTPDNFVRDFPKTVLRKKYCNYAKIARANIEASADANLYFRKLWCPIYGTNTIKLSNSYLALSNFSQKLEIFLQITLPNDSKAIQKFSKFQIQNFHKNQWVTARNFLKSEFYHLSGRTNSAVKNKTKHWYFAYEKKK